jgi:hypothetical protein
VTDLVFFQLGNLCRFSGASGSGRSTWAGNWNGEGTVAGDKQGVKGGHGNAERPRMNPDELGLEHAI